MILQPSVVMAREIVQKMYPGMMVAASCNILDDSNIVFWSIIVSRMEKVSCDRCQKARKEMLASTYIPQTFADAVEEINKQMANHSILPDEIHELEV
ncbi:hypothetical protein [Geobacter sp. SVR]|uniref:hypothetical protein n=1 Tax=Geobacter sp. SVR TaxID=2495594 RepID=UPI00143F0477|nr:hypothetical protein [Geobacter sp. SVR]BCS54751.1 hypothetical protein GSVR_30590 [Geobacter sp. SVR]GCF86441.1 hypothetical protein GSbR_30410 [Geobacter sp. SVR]